MTLELEGLTKVYKDKTALDDYFLCFIIFILILNYTLVTSL